MPVHAAVRRPRGRDPPEPKTTDENIVTILRRNVELVRNEKADAGEQAVALCWVFHLVGGRSEHRAARFRTQDF